LVPAILPLSVFSEATPTTVEAFLLLFYEHVKDVHKPFVLALALARGFQ
jgi:hypothetical protein